jgi:hypothetical protein
VETYYVLTSAIFSDRQQIFSDRQQFFTDRKQIFLTVSNFLLTVIHMIIAPAYASRCVTTTQNRSHFHLQGIACFRLIHDSQGMAGPSSRKYPHGHE